MDIPLDAHNMNRIHDSPGSSGGRFWFSDPVAQSQVKRSICDYLTEKDKHSLIQDIGSIIYKPEFQTYTNVFLEFAFMVPNHRCYLHLDGGKSTTLLFPINHRVIFAIDSDLEFMDNVPINDIESTDFTSGVYPGEVVSKLIPYNLYIFEGTAWHYLRNTGNTNRFYMIADMENGIMENELSATDRNSGFSKSSYGSPKVSELIMKKKITLSPDHTETM
jgi:hypothetical protein